MERGDLDGYSTFYFETFCSTLRPITIWVNGFRVFREDRLYYRKSHNLRIWRRVFCTRGSISSLLYLIMVFAVSGQCQADDDYRPVYHPQLDITRAAGEIEIDGDLDDAGWKNAAVASGFAEHQPGDQVQPPVDTRVLMTYDERRIYVAFICYDNPEDIRRSLCERDRIYGDDNVGFFLDTYGDASWAYTMNVNPYGIQADALWSNGYGEDSKYDLIWRSSGQVTDSGYQVEIAIPFSSLRFPNREKQTWRVDFWRHHRRESHYQISWAAYDRNEPCWPCQWGTVTGIESVKPGKGIEIIPALVGHQSSQLSGDGEEMPYRFENEDIDGDLSVSAKYSVSSSVTAEVTLNPDFSQVEADADQIDVNSTTALSFPEKRPFFQEGSDLFRTFFRVVHTRTINNPTFAAKLTARINRTSLAYLGAHDENSPVILPFEEGSSDELEAGKSLTNLLRLRQTFGENSQAGFLITDRRFEKGGSGSSYTLDGSFRLSQNVIFKWQSTASYTDEPDDSTITAVDSELSGYLFDGKHTARFDGENFWGHAYITHLEFNARDIFLSGRYSEMSPTFRVDNGDELLNNRRMGTVMANYTIRPKSDLIETIESNLFAARIWNIDGAPKDAWVMIGLETQLSVAQISLEAEYMRSAENYSGVQFGKIWDAHFAAQVVPNAVISFGGSLNYGHRIARRAVVMGKELALFGWVDFKPIDRILLGSYINFRQSKDLENGGELFKGFIARSKLSLQITRELSLRLVAQYNDFFNTWDFDPLITYRLSPFSLFYIGTTYDYQKSFGLIKDGSWYGSENGKTYNILRLRSRQFFLKLQYLFQV